MILSILSIKWRKNFLHPIILLFIFFKKRNLSTVSTVIGKLSISRR